MEALIKSPLRKQSWNEHRLFNFEDEVILTGAHIDAFNWLMHLADGTISNFEISKRSKLDISIVNEAIAAMYQKHLLELK